MPVPASSCSLFVDGAVQVSLSGSRVRIDLGVLMTFVGGNEEGEEDPSTITHSLVPTHQVLMPLEGFVRAVAMQQQVIDQLITDGTLRLLREGG